MLTPYVALTWFMLHQVQEKHEQFGPITGSQIH